ncbi:hypothetical protein [Paracoccus ravus]|uniref:hypothetical protein n=1 Tax=Paracoccus ravus TaxID=2447760 RepID=UPI0014307DBF|nr:hypothetical protein [Paracoccus ravus]
MTDVPLHQHWRDIYRWRGLILVTAACAGLAAWLFSISVTPIYEAKTTFYLASNTQEPHYLGPAPDAPPGVLYPTPEEKAASLDVGILRGREIMEALARRLDMPLGEVQKRVDVTVSGEFMLDVFARHPDPQRAARMANEARDLYREFHERSMRQRAADRAAALEAQIAALREERAALDARLLDLRMGSLSTADAAALAQLQESHRAAETRRDELHGRLAETSARIASLDAALESEAAHYSRGETLDTTALLASMQEILLQLRVDLASNTEGPASPRRQALQGQIEDLEASISRETARIEQAQTRPPGSMHEQIRLERALAIASQDGLNALLAASEQALDKAAASFRAALAETGNAEERGLEADRLDLQISTASANLASARLQANHATPPLVLVEQASAPLRPIFPLVTLNIIVAALCGLIFGAYYALFVAHSHRAAHRMRVEHAPLPLFDEHEMAQLRAGNSDAGFPAAPRGTV